MRHLNFSIFLLLLLLWGGAWAEVLPDPIQVDTDKKDGRHSLILRNRHRVPVTFRFEFTNLDNCRLEGSQLTFVVPARGFSRGPVVLRKDHRSPWKWNYKSFFHYGDWTRTSTEGTYALPFSRGKAYKLSQGFHGTLSHHGTEAYALDFNLPVGTPVTAARDGLVVNVEERYSEGRWDISLKEKANTVVLAHPDGTLSRYVHLQQNSVVVDPGDWVQSGQLLGRSGNTGYTTGPHLHFDVYSPGPDLKIRTLEFRLDEEGRPVLPVEGRIYQN